ncbi:KPN_02809 family neutral zinc metallopeptidase [Sandaracinobacteroides hominis]|uniref:KPN_02809 family neutral zinc metallopeptidase n=1 Tax=Sandaracinobacteroides hominis TaxID=2780086 RepID=UPI0018F34A24|nr:neutral zinc metallopeptidase [Sandaracinobacteroides hominis]
MRLDDQRESSNVEDRRGEGGIGFGGGGGQQAGGFGGMGGLLGLLIPLIGSKFGIVGIIVAFGAVFLLSNMGGGGSPAVAPHASAPTQSAPAPQMAPGSTDQFVAKVLATTEDTWSKLFAASGEKYPAPKLVLFDGSIRSACGSASAASGPFYCPGDQKVYLDTSFFDELHSRFGAPGDFAAAYVIAHEVGHHIQTITGISDEVTKRQKSARSQAEANQWLMRLELQADCYAGVWAANNRNLLDSGDFAEGVRAAQAIGDDTLQKQAQGRVVPDSFTHGSAAQRVRWLTRGFESGNPNACDTFNIPAAQL